MTLSKTNHMLAVQYSADKRPLQDGPEKHSSPGADSPGFAHLISKLQEGLQCPEENKVRCEEQSEHLKTL